MNQQICPNCDERGFPFMKPVKLRGKAYSYLYYGHYDADKYKRNGGNKSHIRWCYIGKNGRKEETLKYG
jgi:hypothetical protein